MSRGRPMAVLDAAPEIVSLAAMAAIVHDVAHMNRG